MRAVPGHPTARRPTVRDVAEHAGVSRMTVTRCFLRPGQVEPATRDRVEAAVTALGYVPDRAAGSLVTRRSGFVGLVLPNLSNGNFAAFAEGLTETLRTAGLDMLVGFTNYRLDEEERQLRIMLSRRPELLVLTANVHTEATRSLLRGARIPVLEIAGLPRDPIGGVIGFSNRAVGRAAGTYLIGLGLKRLAAIGPAHDPAFPDTRGEERLAGFAEALREHGLPDDRVHRTATMPVSFEQGARATAALLDTRDPIEGLFAISDLLGVGALMECRRRGIDVPGALSVIGFGNFDIGRQMVPPLSTIDVDFHTLGRRAGQMIPDMLADGSGGAGLYVDVGFTLRPRGTTSGSAGPEGDAHGR